MMVHGDVKSRVWLQIAKNKAQTFNVIQIPALIEKLDDFIARITGGPAIKKEWRDKINTIMQPITCRGYKYGRGQRANLQR